MAALHLFHDRLRREDVDWVNLIEPLSRLSDGTLSDLSADLPDEWTGWSKRVHEHIRAVRDHVIELQVEVIRSLA
jgi:hypothetical protein